MDDGDGGSPIALTGDQPVAEAVVDAFAGVALISDGIEHLGDRGVFVVREANEFRRGSDVTAKRSTFGKSRCNGCIRLVIGFTVDKANRQPHGFCKVKVALVVCGDSHDGAGSVASEDVVSDPDWNVFAIDWILCVSSGEYTRFWAIIGGAVLLGCATCGIDVGIHIGLLLRGCNRGDQRVFRGQDEECGTPEGVGACGENGDVL